VAGLGTISALGRNNADVLAALRAAVTRWRAAPKGSRLIIVRTHISSGEIVAWRAAFDELGLTPHQVNVGGDLLLVVPPGGG
jgi:hypothetical protein